MRSSLVVITLALLALLAAGCGGQTTTQTTPTSETTSPTPSNALVGSWPEQAGQADNVQRTLSVDGYECTRHAVERLDLRMCVKSLPAKDSAKPNPVAQLRFLADGKGTVVRAAVDATDIAEGRQMRTQMLKTLLPEQDVAVVEAGGAKLTWGSATKQSGVTHLLVKGGAEARHAVSHRTLSTSKEQALPKLQAAGLTCRISDKQTSLDCTAPQSGDVRSTVTLTDNGVGLTALTIKGVQGKTPENTAAVKALVPKAFGITDELADVRSWVEKHLDGLEHAAYVGDWLVTVQVGLSPMFGDSVVVHVGDEKDDLGASGK